MTLVAHKWITCGKMNDGWPLVTHRWTTGERDWWLAIMAGDGPPVGRNFIVIWVGIVTSINHVELVVVTSPAGASRSLWSWW